MLTFAINMLSFYNIKTIHSKMKQFKTKFNHFSQKTNTFKIWHEIQIK